MSKNGTQSITIQHKVMKSVGNFHCQTKNDKKLEKLKALQNK
jgi:hypothetical protein